VLWSCRCLLHGCWRKSSVCPGDQTKSSEECTHAVLKTIKEIMWMTEGALVVCIHSDEGGEFWNNIMTKVTDKLGVFQTRAEGYDTKVERNIERLKHDGAMKLMEAKMPITAWYWSMRQSAIKYRWAKLGIDVPTGGAPDFGERVMVRRAKANKLPTFEPKTADGIFLAWDMDVIQ